MKIHTICYIVALICTMALSTWERKEPFTAPVEKPIIVNDVSFTVDQIYEGIKDTFNSVMYYHRYENEGNNLIINTDVILCYDVEYELYLDMDDSRSDMKKDFDFSPRIYILITNMQHPESSDKEPLLYNFAININQWGLQSDFYMQSFGTLREVHQNYSNMNAIYLGSYTMRIDEVTKPQYETMDAEWMENVKNAIRLYMDDEQWSPPLEKGKYNVCIQKFFKSDRDSVIIFEHENGNIYMGFYYFVQYASSDHLADLNKVSLVENGDFIKTYLEKVKADPAVSMEYSIK